MSAPSVFDEMHGLIGRNERPAPDSPGLRAAYREIAEWLKSAPLAQLQAKSQEADALFRRMGITFAVYGEGGDPERLIPFDIVPRVLDGAEWDILERGLVQRVKALNAFLADVYGSGEILKAGKIPAELVLHNPMYLKEMVGFVPPNGVYTHISGIDIVRVGPEEFYVLEDNCRCPSGVSYMIENREAMMRLFPELFLNAHVRPVSHYPDELLGMLRSVAPPACKGQPEVAILTPGAFNSAYFEHCFLADEMGVDLVEGADLVVEDNIVYRRTTQGLRRVDVIYRRIDDDFLDPLVFRKDSALGTPGLMAAYKAGTVTLANAPGAGVADDKSVYRHVPDMVEFYLDETPILKNVPTFECADPKQLSHVLDNIAELVVKRVDGSGGYGMLVGPKSTRAQCEAFAEIVKANPDRYVAQPTLALSTCPTLVEEGVAPRHVDLRPFILTGKEITIVPGGLTRVALANGSLVVNSSQGGGTKDTWVLDAGAAEGAASC